MYCTGSKNFFTIGIFLCAFIFSSVFSQRTGTAQVEGTKSCLLPGAVVEEKNHQATIDIVTETEIETVHSFLCEDYVHLSVSENDCSGLRTIDNITQRMSDSIKECPA